MTPEEQALKASIEQRLKKLAPEVTNTGTGLRFKVRGADGFVPFVSQPGASTKSIG